ncbi:hypothetical protein GQ53DRAFT_788502 [Thozetella sp. PMI_491]|nr:hypothetical protein GQ53DRAFT_788502 [Thozetella sp. PMI_491]
MARKDRKNGKDSGGVIAAVTKNGSKFSCVRTPSSLAPFPWSGNGNKGPSTSPSPPAIQSPEMKPSSPPPKEIPAPSPLLDAVSTTSFATSNSPNTREWTKAISAGIAGSPGNLISLVGESPPTAPSSYEDHRGITSGWSSPRPYHIPSVSPPAAPARRPLSFHMDAHYSPPDHLHSLNRAEPPSTRRSSMHSHYAHAAQMRNASASKPPLPHHPQPHFYGAPDIDFDLNPQSGMVAGERSYYFGFDSIPVLQADQLPGKDAVVLAGYEGGLEVHAVSKRGLEPRASIKGLRGGVYHARVLPWTSDLSDLFPLVAAVVHGPHIPLSAPGIQVDGDYDAVSADRSEAMANVGDAISKDGLSAKTTPGFVESYQTTVEVYSLATGKHVCTLLEAPKIPLKQPITSPIFKAPPPTGAFQIKADSGNLVVASGVTGECWVYRQAPISPEHGVQFRCLGKLWTTLQQPLKGDASQEPETSRLQQAPPPRPRPQSAIIALNGRWIAYCPAAPSSQIALRASIPVATQGRAPLLTSLTPPQLPPANADVDLPLSESVMNKFMRDATQELIQGAKWVGKHGWQVWNNYWNPGSQPNQPPRSPPPGPQSWGNAGRPDAAQFPPTHGTVTPPAPKEPGLVSILDVESMNASNNLHPIATFPIPQGCGFLSFSPTGLSLFTASTKGDVQTVWDLMRIQYTKSSPLQSFGAPFSGGPRVRQIAQFSRMTVARIVDVAWTKPNGQRVAMVTERGTVHLLDLPPSAFTWPPPRRRTRQQDAKGGSAEGPASAVSLASNALSSVRDAARPLITRPRRSSSNNQQATVASGISDYATHGGKVIAASISHSLGKTGTAISQLRHTGEKRVSLPSTTAAPGPSCVTWIAGKRDHFLFVLGDGLVRTFPIKNRKTSSGDSQRVPRLSRYKDFKVPRLPDDLIALSVRAYIDPEEYLDLTERDLDAGNNTMVLAHKPRPVAQPVGTEAPIPQAEIESSAPYQPFHTDRRVALYEYTSSQLHGAAVPQVPSFSNLVDAAGHEDEPSTQAPKRKSKGSKANKAAPDTRPMSLKPSGAWAFGQPIAAIKLDIGLPPVADEALYAADLEASRALPVEAMERFLHRGDDDGEIVVTTRRRRGAGRAGDPDEDGFFEDDCEVLDFADQRV